jgi:hypothetical protein
MKNPSEMDESVRRSGDPMRQPGERREEMGRHRHRQLANINYGE